MRATLLSLFLTLAAPAVAWGAAPAAAPAGGAAPVDDRPVQRFNEVERGFFLGVQVGGGLFFAPKAADGYSGSKFSTGRSLGLTLGVDVSEKLALSVLMLGTQVNTPLGFQGPNTGTVVVDGDFSSLSFGALAEFAVLTLKDSNQVDRFYLRVRGGGCWGLMGPKNYFPDSDIQVFGGVGVEYYTRLRHFSVGANADFLFGVNDLGPGLTLSPTLRYTF